MNRFRYYVITLTILFFAAPAAAQFSVGVIAGANFANLSLTDDGEDEDTNRRTTFGGGIVADFMLGPDMVVSFQPMILGKGAEQDETENFFEAEIKLSYIELPILFRYLFGSGNVRPFVEAGPSIGFLSSAEVEFGDGDEIDIENQVKSTDFSIVFGGGAELPVGNNSAFVVFRYAAGLSNVGEDADDDDDLKTKGIMFGFKVPIGNN